MRGHIDQRPVHEASRACRRFPDRRQRVLCGLQVGCACATGLGEEVMKGCVSYEIVRLMKQGLTPMQACEQAVMDFDHDLRRRRGSAGDMSLIAMNAQGEWGISTNIDTFSFVTASESQPAIVWLAQTRCTRKAADQTGGCGLAERPSAGIGGRT